MNRCPSCNSPIYSRKRIDCGVCGEKLPSELLLTAEQRSALDAINKDCRENHEAFLKKNTPEQDDGLTDSDDLQIVY